MSKNHIDLTGAKILIVDDQPANLGVLVKSLEPAGYNLFAATSGEQAIQIAKQATPSLILLDIIMEPGIDGIETCRRLKADPLVADIPVIFVTVADEIERIVEGFRVGGVDYIPKPFREEELLARVQTHLTISQLTKMYLETNIELVQANRELQQEIARREQAENALEIADEQLSVISTREAKQWGIPDFAAQSQTMAEIIEGIRRLHSNDRISVLITGESGTGKEMIARAIHYSSPRSKGPFETLNCTAIPAELAESTLFGHLRGAFTGANTDKKGYFEICNNGTLFLDEIGDMPKELQSKLLRVLESGIFTPVGGTGEKKTDVRIISATNADLQAKITAGEFREDFYFRLAGYPVDLPPLRERKEDIPLLVSLFLNRFATEMRLEKTALSQKALTALTNYAFPGNIRELRNIIERALILSGGTTIQPQHLHFIEATGATDISPKPDKAIEESTPQSDAELPPYLPPEEKSILTYVQQHGSISNVECRGLLSINKNQATYQLDKMQQSGLLTRHGSGRSVRYYLP